MTHTPYGYKIVNAQAVIDEEAAEKVRALFEEYLKHGSLSAAARASGIEKTHSVTGRMLKNEIYLGTDFYPRLIDKETFQKVQELRTSVAQQLGRIREYKPKEAAPMNLAFEVGAVEKKFQDPYEQARFAYAQIKEISNEG